MSQYSFHQGEIAIQRRLGIQEKMNVIGKKVVRNYLPEQHRQFFKDLPLIYIAGSDNSGRLWAFALCGPPGFIHSPTENLLVIDSNLIYPQSSHNFIKMIKSAASGANNGIQVGILGLQHESKRRNRANGILYKDGTNYCVRINQSFGNCPKYIRPRRIIEKLKASPSFTFCRTEFTADDNKLIEHSDTFLIATQAASNSQSQTEAGHGVDISHRGGQPGFIKLLSLKTLVFPDYKGNGFFNSLGNLDLNPNCTLLFCDYRMGHSYELQGHARLLWGETEPLPIPEYERNIVFTLNTLTFREGSSPYRWEAIEK